MAATPAIAHPHVFVTARVEVLFDERQEIDAVRHVWTFDLAFSAYAAQGYDVNNDGVLTVRELAPLAATNVESLAEVGYFTQLANISNAAMFLPPSEHWIDIRLGQLTLFYTLPLKEPLPVDSATILRVFDPDYYVTFTFNGAQPAILVGAADGCYATYHPPRALDDSLAALLAAIPADQRELPPPLVDAAAGLGHAIEVKCQ
jgi:ABC-type uncharacterized transport system substrate-binding protein